MTDHKEEYSPMQFVNAERRRLTTRSVSMAMPPSYHNGDALISHTGPLYTQRETELGVISSRLNRNMTLEKSDWPGLTRLHNRPNAVMQETYGREDPSDRDYEMRNEHLQKSGPLGLCNNPDCTECPAAYRTKRGYQRTSVSLDKKIHNILYGDDDNWFKKWITCLNSRVPIMNPHNKYIQMWNQFFVISCLFAIFIDPVFFFLLSAEKADFCLYFQQTSTILRFSVTT